MPPVTVGPWTDPTRCEEDQCTKPELDTCMLHAWLVKSCLACTSLGLESLSSHLLLGCAIQVIAIAGSQAINNMCVKSLYLTCPGVHNVPSLEVSEFKRALQPIASYDSAVTARADRNTVAQMLVSSCNAQPSHQATRLAMAFKGLFCLLVAHNVLLTVCFYLHDFKVQY